MCRLTQLQLVSSLQPGFSLVFVIYLTESQNGRGWEGPLWVIQSNPLPKQGHTEQAAQHRVQAGLEYLQRRRLHNLPGRLWTPNLTERKNWKKLLCGILKMEQMLSLCRL